MNNQTTLKDLLLQVMQVSAKDGGTFADRIIKVTEEVGEIAAGFGNYSGYKYPKKEITSQEALANVKEECIDSIIILLDILTRDFSMDDEEFVQSFNEKIKAWENVVAKKKARLHEESKITPFSTWRNKKTGGYYRVLFPLGYNTTNSQSHSPMVTYTNIENVSNLQFSPQHAEPPYHKNVDEFLVKFEFVRS